MNYIKDSFERLRKYCEAEDFRGWDPFDGLNSAVFKFIPFNKTKFIRLAWLQAIKRSSFNLRPALAVPKEHNAKGLALFLRGYLALEKYDPQELNKEKIEFLTKRLLELHSPGYDQHCWGYNFDWQSRAFFLPKSTPNVIVSTFTGNAFLDLFKQTGNSKYLDIAKDVTRFIRDNLRRSYGTDKTFCFSYSALDNSQIYNASMLASAFLARVYSLTREEALLKDAQGSLDFCVARQNNDGSWYYGEAANHKWIDSFHTAYNLEALYDYECITKDTKYRAAFEKGKAYYLGQFFTKDGLPVYYHNKPYPYDTHSAAEAIVLLVRTGLYKEKKGLLNKLLSWTIDHMQDKKGYFYYQANGSHCVKTPYMRWVCSWMFYALSLYLAEMNNSLYKKNNNHR